LSTCKTLVWTGSGSRWHYDSQARSGSRWVLMLTKAQTRWPCWCWQLTRLCKCVLTVADIKALPCCIPGIQPVHHRTCKLDQYHATSMHHCRGSQQEELDEQAFCNQRLGRLHCWKEAFGRVSTGAGIFVHYSSHSVKYSTGTIILHCWHY
jgi:hypothetical protein